jgi:two-component system OmpR family sensor kinase
VVSFISSWLLASYFSRPIRTLRQALHGLAKGNLAQRISQTMGTRRDELSDLSRDFDHMAEQIQTLMHSQKRLLHDVSHELRSPLARLQVSIGLARQQPERCLQTLERIEREAQRLDHLVGEVLTLSRLEAGVPQAIDEYLDILELLDAVVDDARFEAQALNKQVNFACELGEALITKGYGELLFRAFDNVIRNALHHTPEHSSVQVSVQWAAAIQQLQVTVEDCGKGVAPEELQSIFAAFQRSQQPSVHKGYGLGLAIAKRAIETHQGRIWAENRSEGGLRISILLPIKP